MYRRSSLWRRSGSIRSRSFPRARESTAPSSRYVAWLAEGLLNISVLVRGAQAGAGAGTAAFARAARRKFAGIGTGVSLAGAAPSTLQSRSEEGPVYAIGAGGAVQLNIDEFSK